MLQGFGAFFAILSGGFWFFWRRQVYPRATLTHEFTVVKLTGEHNLLHVKTKISNAGHILLRLVSAEARVQLILPLSDEFQAKLEANEDIVPQGEFEAPWPTLMERKKQWGKEWSWLLQESWLMLKVRMRTHSPSSSEWIWFATLTGPLPSPCHPEKISAGKWLWRQFRYRGCEIEPGESDEIDFDFVLADWVKTIEMYTYFHNANKRGHDVGWCLTTLYEIPSKSIQTEPTGKDTTDEQRQDVE